MTGITKIKNYFLKQDICYIPRCKARCCGDAPLPEDFLPKYKSAIQRNIYGAANIGKNSLNDNFNSVVYNTRPVPLIMIGHTQDGHAYIFDKGLAHKLNIKNTEEAAEILQNMEAQKVYNYCPFLNVYGKCSVYSIRPQICREFGSSPLKINFCHKKSSRLDIFKYNFYQFFDLKNNLKNIYHEIKLKFKNA